MPSVKGLISEPVNTGSSYDQEPTRATYLQCILTVLDTISNSECSVRNEFVQQIDITVSQLEIPVSDQAKGYFKFNYHGFPYIAKGAKIALKKCVLGGRAFFVKPDITRRTESDVIIAYSPRSARIKILTPSMVPFQTPHTMHFGDQCTGNIVRPRSDNFREIKRFLDELEPSLCIANFDSLASHYFGDFNIDNGTLTHEQAIMNLCTPRRPNTVPRVVQGGTAIAQTNNCGFMCWITHFWKDCPHPNRVPVTVTPVSNPVPEQQQQPVSIAGQMY
jgi:hypothetical protein